MSHWKTEWDQAIQKDLHPQTLLPVSVWAERLWAIRTNLCLLFEQRRWRIREEDSLKTKTHFFQQVFEECSQTTPSNDFWNCMQLFLVVGDSPLCWSTHTMEFPQRKQTSSSSSPPLELLSGSRLILLFKPHVTFHSQAMQTLVSFVRKQRVEGLFLIYEKKPPKIIQTALEEAALKQTPSVLLEQWVASDLLIRPSLFLASAPTEGRPFLQPSRLRIWKASDSYIQQLLNHLDKSLDCFPSLSAADPVASLADPALARTETLVFEWTSEKNEAKMYRVLEMS